MASLCFSHLTYGIPLLNCMKPCATDVPSHLIFDTSITVSLVNPIPLKGLRHCTQTAFKIFAFLLFEIRHKNSLKGYLLIHLSDVRWKSLIYCLFDGFMLFILCNSKTGFPEIKPRLVTDKTDKWNVRHIPNLFIPPSLNPHSFTSCILWTNTPDSSFTKQFVQRN